MKKKRVAEITLKNGEDAIYIHNDTTNKYEDGLSFRFEQMAMRDGVLAIGNYLYQFVYTERDCYMARAKINERGGEWFFYKRYFVDASDKKVIIYDSKDDFLNHLIDMGIILPN